MPPKRASWFYTKQGQEYGPVSADFLIGLAARGELFPEDLVRKTSMKGSVPAGTVMGLFQQNDQLTSIIDQRNDSKANVELKESADTSFQSTMPFRPKHIFIVLFLLLSFFGLLFLMGTCVETIHKVSTSESQTPSVKIGSTYSLEGRAFLSTDKDTVKAMIECVKAHDREAWDRYYCSGRILSGSAVGSTVTVVDFDFWTGLAKVRARGQIEEYWVHSDYLH